ncbi:MAG TPA: NDP-sugar synthase [Actinomycetota bacterium]|nr:NDP-sugar synthase [Actinomycetota bacterium]
MQAVILAGGFGTRLRPLTSTRPKPLIPFANEPFLLHTLRQLAAGGFTEVVLSTMYLPEAFDQLLPEARKAGVEVVLSSEDTPMGTSGAIKRLAHLLDGTFLVLNGDVLVDIDFQRLVALHRERQAAATLALVRVPDPSAFGLVPVDDDDRVTAFLEKPGDLEDSWVTDLINAGVYVLEPSVLDHVPAGQPSSFERNLFPSLLASGAPVYGYELHGYWRDLGTPIAYLAAQFDLLEGRLHLPINATERGRSQWFADDTRIAEGAVLRGPILVGQGATVEEEGRVFGPTVLGPGTVVAGGARLERSVLLEGARIERGAKVSDSIIGRGVVVGDGAVVRDGAVVGDNVEIEAGNILAGGVRVAPNVRLGLGAIRF